MDGQYTVRVPATSANLGPGFDSFGLALGIYNTFTAHDAEEWDVTVRGADTAHINQDATNPVARAMDVAFERAGCAGRAARLVCDNGIPPGRGLGSSAAAIIGGLMLGNALCGEKLDDSALLELATELEGHPDNVAAALHGGLTISATGETGPVTFPVPIAGGLAAVVVVSRAPFKTARARKLLPARVPHADAAFNAGRAGMLVAGLIGGDARLIGEGLHDRIHEQYRAETGEGLDEVVSALVEAGATGAVLSGAGPSVLALVADADDDAALAHAAEVAQRSQRLVAETGAYRAPVAVPIERSGASLLRVDLPEPTR